MSRTKFNHQPNEANYMAWLEANARHYAEIYPAYGWRLLRSIRRRLEKAGMGVMANSAVIQVRDLGNLYRNALED